MLLALRAFLSRGLTVAPGRVTSIRASGTSRPSRRNPATLLALLLIGAVAYGAANNAPASDGSPDAASPFPRVLVLGDSISAAYGMSLEQGWVAVLERQIAQRWSGAQFINASISGDTSAGGLRRLGPLLSSHDPDLLIIELGGNDGLRGYPTNKLRDNLSAMAREAQATGSAVLILPMEIPPNYGPRYTQAFRAAFGAAAEETGSTLGPFMLDGIATDSSLMQADGIHPTVEAQSAIARLLQPHVEAILADLTGS